MIRRQRLTLLLLPALLLAAAPAAALEAGDKLAIGVNGQAGYGRTDGNTFGAGTEEGSYENTAVALSLMAHPAERLLIGTQLHFAGGDEGAVEVDWAFAEWKLHDALRLRLGKSKHPFGLYGESLDVGTLRPFFELPTVMYGPAHLVGEGYVGAGLTGFYRLSKDWAIAYDVYGGELHVVAYEPYEQLFEPDTVPGQLEMTESRDLVGGRVTLETPVEGLTFMVSGYSGMERDTFQGAADRPHRAAAASVEYLTDAITARAEYAALEESKEADTQAAYVELAYKFRVGIQLAARAEGSWIDADGFDGSSALLRHREAAVGVNYWFTPDLVVKASYHLVDGNRFAYAPDQTPATLDTSTQLVVVGAQFSF
jgi:opacity protein-like surface antigen